MYCVKPRQSTAATAGIHHLTTLIIIPPGSLSKTIQKEGANPFKGMPEEIQRQNVSRTTPSKMTRFIARPTTLYEMTNHKPAQYSKYEYEKPALRAAK